MVTSSNPKFIRDSGTNHRFSQNAFVSKMEDLAVEIRGSSGAYYKVFMAYLNYENILNVLVYC